MPGLVLALGLLTPVLAIDNGLNALAGWLGARCRDLILVGSGAAVVIAYVIRFLAVPTGLIKAGFERIPRDYDDSARAAGAANATTMRLIHLPLLRPAMLGAAIIVFVDCLKELPATLLLRPLNVETLATSIYQFASRGSFEEGALAALLIVAASIGPVVVADAVFRHAERAGVDSINTARRPGRERSERRSGTIRRGLSTGAAGGDLLQQTTGVLRLRRSSRTTMTVAAHAFFSATRNSASVFDFTSSSVTPSASSISAMPSLPCLSMVKTAEIGHHHVDHLLAGQRQVARASAVSGRPWRSAPSPRRRA